MSEQDANRPPILRSSRSLFGLNSEKIPACFLALLMLYAAIKNICQAATRPFWYDEICTFIMVRQERISTLWSALKQGADVQPPGFYVAERFVTPLIANENIGFRLLSMLGLLSTVLCLFFLIKKQRDSVVALVCAAIPLITILYTHFAVESRPYVLVVAFIAFALVCYQHAPSGRWMILMGISLALAQSFHYYAAFAFLPLFAAEAFFLLSERHLRWPVWLALCSGLLPLIPFWSLLWRSRAIYAAHFWAQPSMQMAESSYGLFLGTSPMIGLAIAAATAITVLGATLYRIRRENKEESATELSWQEPLIILTFLSLPFVCAVMARLAHGGMDAKYVLPTVLGFPLAAGYVFPRSGRKLVVPISALVIVLLIFMLQEKGFWSSYSGRFSSPADSVELFVGSAGHADLPVVVSDAQDFMPLSHYASPAWTSRFVSVIDAPEAVAYTGSDSADKEFPILATYYPLHVFEFKDFVAEHPAFLLYSSKGGTGADWWPRKLLHDGYTLRPVAVKPKAEHDYSHRVFLVTRTKDAD
jgi:hypothetical protein